MKLLIITQKVDKNDSVLGFFHAWIAEFAKHCEQVTVICLYKGTYTLPANVEVFSLGKEEGISRIKYVVRFCTYIHRHRASYTHVFVHMNPEYIVLGGLYWRFLGKQIGLWYLHKSVTWKLQVAEKITHTIFSATPSSFRLPSKKLHIVGHGIDTEHFAFKPHSYQVGAPFTLLSVGRLAPIKQHKLVLETVRLLREQGVAVQLLVIGGTVMPDDEKYCQVLRDYVATHGLQAHVQFTGAVTPEQLPGYFQQGDLFVHVSQTGSLDKVSLEAMATGVPVISLNDAVLEILPEELRSFATIVADARILSERIQKIISLPESERTRLQESFRRTVVENASLEKLIPNVLSLLKDSGSVHTQSNAR